MRTIKTIFLFLALSAVFNSQAQSGMDAIRSNNFPEARKIFKTQLEKDSLHFESLTGMILLSEISQEYLQFDKYVNVLLRNHKDAYTFALFNFLYDGNYKDIEKMNYPDWVTIKYKIRDAIDWGNKNRDRTKLWDKYAAIIPKVEWSFIGPFRNLNGSGYIVEHPIETEKFSPDKIYKNDDGIKLSWINPLYSAATGRIVFTQHLPSAGYSSDGVYFANSFINLSEDKTIQLKLGRTAPMKIWIDEQLVFSNNHCVPFYYDLETIKVNLSKGTHRVLVKNASQKNASENYGVLDFWDGNSYEHEMIAIRFTDSDGNPLTNISSSFNSNNYITPDNKLNASVTSNSLVEHFKNQSQSNENLWYDYCLLKAYLSENYTKEGEAYFSNRYKSHSDAMIYNYFFAKMCQFNGKREKVYELLSKADETKTPFFGILYEKLQEINLDSDPEKYLEAIKKLSLVSPSNYSVLRAYIEYYDKTGKLNEKDSFVKANIILYPKYESELEYNLSNYKEKEERYGPAELLKTQKASIKALKSGSDEYDMDNAIEYYKDRKKKAKVIELYKDKIYYSPHYVSNYSELADYLKEIEKYSEAKEILLTSLKINPYLSSTYEDLGDIAKIEGNQKEALSYYQAGLRIGATSSYGYGNNLSSKVEQIVGAENYKRIFKTFTFNETLNNEAWYEMTENEDAIVLQYTKDMVLDTNYKIHMYQSIMVKILKESAIEKYHEMDLSYMGTITSAKVIKEDGTESTPEKSGGYIVIKNLQPGDVIQVEGHDDFVASTYFGQEYYHQHFIFFPDPVFYSKFDFAVPNGKNLEYTSHKMKKTPNITKDEFGFDHYIWEDNNLEKIQTETAFPDYYDYYRSVTVGTIEDWEPINDWYEQTTYQKTDLTYEIKEILDTLVSPSMTDQQKIQKIYNYITTKIRYSYVAFLNSRFVPKWPGNTCSAGIGDCKDVATLMITMLKSQGIESYYALVKTNHYNRLATVPSLAFDHVVVCYVLEGKKYYCDLTTNFFPLNVLPEMDNDAMALLIKPGVKEIFHLPNDMLDVSKTKSTYTIDAELVNGRDMKITAVAKYTGTAGGNLREQIYRTPQNKYNDFMSQQFGQDIFENANFETVLFENLESFSDPLNAKFELIGKGFADRVSGLYILRMPYLEGIKKHQAILESNRTNRVDLEQILSVTPSEQIINLKMPDGYKLAEMPKDIIHNSKFSQYSVKFKMNGNVLQIIKNQTFSQSIIEIEQFSEFKEDYLKLLDLDKFKIALIKK